MPEIAHSNMVSMVLYRNEPDVCPLAFAAPAMIRAADAISRRLPSIAVPRNGNCGPYWSSYVDWPRGSNLRSVLVEGRR